MVGFNWNEFMVFFDNPLIVLVKFIGEFKIFNLVYFKSI